MERKNVPKKLLPDKVLSSGISWPKKVIKQWARHFQGQQNPGATLVFTLHIVYAGKQCNPKRVLLTHILSMYIWEVQVGTCHGTMKDSDV